MRYEYPLGKILEFHHFNTNDRINDMYLLRPIILLLSLLMLLRHVLLPTIIYHDFELFMSPNLFLFLIWLV